MVSQGIRDRTVTVPNDEGETQGAQCRHTVQEEPLLVVRGVPIVGGKELPDRMCVDGEKHGQHYTADDVDGQQVDDKGVGSRLQTGRDPERAQGQDIDNH